MVQTHRQYLPLAEMGTAHTTLIMGLRKALSTQLLNAAKVLSEDKSKERVSAAVINLRVGLAQAIMPKHQPTVRKY